MWTIPVQESLVQKLLLYGQLQGFMEKDKGSKKIQVTFDLGIYEIVQDLKDRVYKTDSDSKVCASIIEAFLNEHGYTKANLERK
ncbi:MAG: hypothetical protein M1158_00775 [Candidatus Marsarchaeota archaeon]|nr:hypothetical protein [Candidatus Marsarchaeota archaeon]